MPKFCYDCPDHEGCMGGIPCSVVKAVARTAAELAEQLPEGITVSFNTAPIVTRVRRCQAFICDCDGIHEAWQCDKPAVDGVHCAGHSDQKIEEWL